jgi:hypothetical protein
VVVNSSSDVFFLIKIKETLPLQKNAIRDRNATAVWELKRASDLFSPLISIKPEKTS